jgi:hypothetical protein
MKLNKSQLVKLVEEALLEEEVKSSQATVIQKLLMKHVGENFVIPAQDIVKYANILDDPKQMGTISSKRKQLLQKIIKYNGERINEDVAFVILRAIEGMSYYGELLTPNKMKFDAFLETILDSYDFEVSSVPEEVESEKSTEENADIKSDVEGGKK